MSKNSMSRRAFTASGVAIGVAALTGLGIPESAQADTVAGTPAFPGAEGCGMYTTGGRNGDVYEVTNLNDSGPGSLRDAVSQSDRTIVFRVSGTIFLQKRLDVLGSNLTIAGQTAPGDGICVAGYSTRIAGHNVIVRYIRCRFGDLAGIDEDAMWLRRTSDVIIDHCSFSWSTDEALSPYENERVTVQWCIVGESLTMSVNSKGRHGFGGIWGGENVSFHHNLIVHNSSRNPRMAPIQIGGPDIDLTVDYRNNVIYNWGYNSCYGGENSAGINMVGNYYKSGPNTLGEVRRRIVEPVTTNLGGPGSWYIDDNYVHGYPAVTADNTLGIDGTDAITLLGQPVAFPQEIDADTAQVAFERVLSEAGAILPRRDAVDARIINAVRNGTGRLINSQREVGGWPPLRSAPAPIDTDHDGIPDDWEIANGLDPQDPADGYTNLERYLNSIERTGGENPMVSLTFPAPDAILATATPTRRVMIQADAQGVGSAIALVEFYVDDTKLGEVTEAPYQIVWPNAADGTYYLTARATDTTGTSTTSEAVPVHVNRTTSMRSWAGVDIGDVPIRGGNSIVDGVITVKGSGNIGGIEDFFRFVYQPLNGDGEIVARVDSIRKVYPEVTGAVMFRGDLASGAVSAMLELTYLGSGQVARFAHRPSVGSVIQSVTSPADLVIATPYWVRLQRSGATVTGSVSADGTTWTTIGSATMSLPQQIYVGLAVDANQEDTQLANYNTVRFSGVAVK